MTIDLWLLLGLNIIIGLAGQVLMKNSLIDNQIYLENLSSAFAKLCLDWRIIVAVVCYFLNLILYLILLSRLEMGHIFTLQVSLGIIAVSMVGVIFYNEQLNTPISLGIAFIIAGIFLINLR